MRKQKLSLNKHPAHAEFVIGSEVRVYDKDTKTYPKTGTIIERLRNSSFLIEFDTPEGQVLARHARFLKLKEADNTLPPQGEGTKLI